MLLNSHARKYVLCLLTFNLLLGVTGFSQDEDSDQSTELLKKNKVKSISVSYQWRGYDLVFMDDYDKEGELVQYMEYDSGGRKRVEGYVNFYDSSHQLHSSYHLDYTVYDKKLNRLKLVDLPDTLWQFFDFDTTKEVQKERLESKNGHVAVLDKSYPKDRHTIHEIFSRDGSRIVTQRWYEEGYITKKTIITIFYPDGSKIVNKSFFNNFFDSSHRIVHRNIKTKSKGGGYLELYANFSDVHFDYLPNGLITRKTYSNHRSIADKVLVMNFKYTFWE